MKEVRHWLTPEEDAKSNADGFRGSRDKAESCGLAP